MILENIEPIEQHLTKVSFSEEIERIMIDEKKESYLSAIVEFCTLNSLDYEDIIKYISTPLKQKIELEAAEMGMLKLDSKPAYQF
jgi:hypothetical protein